MVCVAEVILDGRIMSAGIMLEVYTLDNVNFFL